MKSKILKPLGTLVRIVKYSDASGLNGKRGTVIGISADFAEMTYYIVQMDKMILDNGYSALAITEHCLEDVGYKSDYSSRWMAYPTHIPDAYKVVVVSSEDGTLAYDWYEPSAMGVGRFSENHGPVKFWMEKEIFDCTAPDYIKREVVPLYGTMKTK